MSLRRVCGWHERWGVVDDDPAKVEAADGLEDPLNISGEDCGLKAVLGVIGLLEGFFEIIIGYERLATGAKASWATTFRLGATSV